MAKEDPHGMVALFSEKLLSNLETMEPRKATEHALAAVKGHLDSSDFVDLGSKSNPGLHFVRVDRRPEAQKLGMKR